MMFRREIPKSRRRSGTALVESAVLMSSLLLILIGILVGGMGVFRYQELAHVSRETARYASLHGLRYATDNPSAATVDLAALKAYAASKAVSLDTSKWTVTVKVTCFPPGATNTSAQPPATGTYDWDDTTNNQNHSPYSSWTQTGPNAVTTACNVVTVTITYPWIPEAIGTGPIYLTSTTVQAMNY